MPKAVPILLVAVLAARLRADVSLVGTTSGKFLQLGSSARPASMAEAYVAVADDAGGLLYNPAGMAGQEQFELQASHTEWFQGAHIENLGAIFPLANGSWGASLSILLLPTQVRTQQIGNVVENGSGTSLGNFQNAGEFSPYDLRATVGWAPLNSKWFKGGLALNVLSEQIDGATSVGLSADMGLLVETGLRGLRAGLALQNLGAPASIVKDTFSPPMYVRLGLAQTLYEAILFSLEGDLPNDNNFAVALGTEVRVGGGIYLRAGYRLDSIFNPWTAGVGVSLWDGNFDLGTSSAGELGQTFRGSLSYHFGGMVSQGRSVDLKVDNELVSAYTQDSAFHLEPLVEAHRKVTSWTLDIHNASQSVRQFTGLGRPNKAVDWDGKVTGGFPASEGVYWSLLSVVFEDGKTEYSPWRRLQLSAHYPEARVEFDPGSEDPQSPEKLFVPASFHVHSSENPLQLRWRLDVVGPDNAVFQSYEGKYGEDEDIVWQGKTDKGKEFVSNSTYRFRVSVLDMQGKVLKQEADVSRLCSFRQ
jgi:hypothetical protein